MFNYTGKLNGSADYLQENKLYPNFAQYSIVLSAVFSSGAYSALPGSSRLLAKFSSL